MKSFFKKILRRSQYHLRDFFNRLRYGKGIAPISFERIWIDPRQVKLYDASIRRRYSGRVIGGEWDMQSKPIAEHFKVGAVRRHFEKSMSWEDSGIIQYMLEKIEQLGEFDDCKTLDDLNDRYAKLDSFYEHLKSGGKFKTMDEINPDNFREHGGVHIHIGRNGELVFGGRGCHRLAIAQVLGLSQIPAQIGVCHKSAVANGLIEGLRHPD